VRSFGGDPTRMVALGCSAGASSLGAARLARARQPIVRGMVLMSGTPVVVNVPNNPGEFRRVAANAGCEPRRSAAKTTSTTTAAAAGAAGADDGARADDGAAESAGALTTAGALTGNGSDSALDDAQQARLELECMKRVDAQQLIRAISNPTLNLVGAPAGDSPPIDDELVFAPSELERRLKAGLEADIVRYSTSARSTLFAHTTLFSGQTFSCFFHFSTCRCQTGRFVEAIPAPRFL
jgi:hypothetical protein